MTPGRAPYVKSAKTVAVSTVAPQATQNTAAFAFVKLLATEVSLGTVELPSIPKVVIHLQRTLADEDVSNAIAVEVLGSEPMLAARLLSVANSAALCGTGGTVNDLRTAVSRVGFNIVRSVALSFALDQLRRASEFAHLAKPLDALWKSSVQIAALCHIVARRFSSLNGDAAMLAGLMHNVGRIYILTRASEHPALFADRLVYESVVRDWHASVSKALLENWGLAEEIVDAAAGYEDHERDSDGPKTLTDVLSLATLLEGRRVADDLGLPSEPLSNALRRMNVQLSECQAVIDESADKISSLTSALGE